VDLLLVARQKDLAVPGAAVPDHVRGPLTHRPGEDSVRCVRQHADLVLDPAGDAGRFQHLTGAAQLLVERRLPVAGDGLSHLAQGLPCDAFDIADLCRGLLWRGGQEASCELALQRDQGEAVAQEVVQVSREAQTLF
jgi:hypothetical protein